MSMPIGSVVPEIILVVGSVVTLVFALFAPRRAQAGAAVLALVTVGAGDDGAVWLLNCVQAGVLALTGDTLYSHDLARYLAAEIACNPWSEHNRLDCLGIAHEAADMNPERVHTHPTGEIQQLLNDATADAAGLVDRSHESAVDVLTGRAEQVDEDEFTRSKGAQIDHLQGLRRDRQRWYHQELDSLNSVEATGVSQLIGLIADAEELVELPGGPTVAEQRARRREELARRWQGVRAWFGAELGGERRGLGDEARPDRGRGHEEHGPEQGRPGAGRHPRVLRGTRCGGDGRGGVGRAAGGRVRHACSRCPAAGRGGVAAVTRR
ncbi:MAG: DUF2397 domain-containing protein [Actinobacteria bacterium]|nr:DUF2397 domain-containing protein [Actinomycetota bacterium]